jgi:hypothetical protein
MDQFRGRNSIKGEAFVNLIMRTHFLLKAKPELMEKKFTGIDGKQVSWNDVKDNVQVAFMGVHTQQVLALVNHLSRIQPKKYKFCPELSHHFHSLIMRTCKCMVYTPKLKAVAIYVPIADVKLSCGPNTAFLTMADHTLKLRAVRDIAAGEAVTFCHSESIVTSPKFKRQKEIGHKLVTCECERCETRESDADVIELLQFSELTDSLRTAYRSGNMNLNDSLVESMRKQLTIAEKCLGKFHPVVVRLKVDACIGLAMKPERKKRFAHEYDRLMSEVMAAIPIAFGSDPDDDELKDVMMSITFTELLAKKCDGDAAAAGISGAKKKKDNK